MDFRAMLMKRKKPQKRKHKHLSGPGSSLNLRGFFL
jgi:hypothetical protein